MGCIISLFRYGTFWPPVVPHARPKSANRGDEDVIAATKIQAGFRGYKTRQELQRAAKAKLSDEDIARRLKPPLCTIKEEEEAAATKIQAGVRGFLTRKRIKHSLDYSFDDGFGGMGSSVENSAAPTPEPSFERVDPSFEKEPIVEPKPQSPVQRVPSVPVPAEPVTVTDVQEDEDIYKIGTMEDSPIVFEEVAEPNLHIETQSEPVFEQQYADEPKVVENVEPEIEQFETRESLEEKESASEPSDTSILPSSSPEVEKAPAVEEVAIKTSTEDKESILEPSDISIVPSSSPEVEKAPAVEEVASKTIEKPDLSSPILPELSTEEVKRSKPTTELKSLPIADMTQLIGHFEPAKSEPVKVAQVPQAETKSPELTKQSSIKSPDAEAQPETVVPAKEESTSQSEPEVEISDSALAETVEPPVQRRSSKRKMKAGTEKYRSGFVIENEINVLEPMQIPSLEEVEAEIEAEMLNNAAAKIQAGFRGFQVRKGLNQAATRIQSNYRGYKTRKELRDKALAATKIQATVRGFLARQRINKIKYQQQRRKSSARRRSSANQNHLKNQVVQQQSVEAAIRIQAAYRGYLVRSKLRESEALQ